MGDKTVSKKLNVDYSVSIKGIPAGVASVTITGGCPESPYDPGEPPEVDYVITDSKGYPARWLEEQMKEEDYQDLDDYLLEVGSYESKNAEAEILFDRHMDA